MMKTKSLTTLLAAIITLLALSVPTMAHHPQGDCDAPAESNFIACAAPAAASSTDDYERLSGNIGPYAITMFLTYDRWKIGDFIGYYYYNTNPNNKFKLKLASMETINIHGSMYVVLKEYTKSGKNSGTFKGQYECRGCSYVGTFTNSKGKKFHFDLG
ncbi:MAG: hypothetical protein IKW85_13530 [Muribaculaceae bacterium]|nr:hypothetical protein [Muribaculaceae bacterium]